MRALVLALVVLALGAADAHATFPGEPGRIAYYRDQAVWTVEADGEHQREVVVGGRDVAWSPDGERIAYVDVESDLWVARPDGRGRARVATNVQAPTWSPDGVRIAFGPGPGADSAALGVVDLATGTRRWLTAPRPYASDSEPTWSPDGARIAFVRSFAPFTCQEDMCGASLPGEQTLHLVTADGTGERQIAAGVSGPDWHPEGDRLLVQRNGGPLPAVVRLRDDTVNPLPWSGHAPSWSPDGRRIVATASPGPRLFTTRPNGEHRRPVGGARGTDAAWQPRPSPVFQPIGTILLRGSGKHRGRGRVVVFAARTGEVAFNLQARGVLRTRRDQAFGVWLTGGGRPRFLGFAPPVGRDGKLAVSGPRESDAKRFAGWLARAKRIVVTRETVTEPEWPGPVLLRARF